MGSGHKRLDRSLPEWNKGKSYNEVGEQPSFLLVADDVLGGFFALNGGGLSPEGIGQIYYFAPDTKEWESLELSYSAFIVWCFQGNLDMFYLDSQWDGYEKDLENISGTQAMSFYPYLWTKEGQDINKCSRKIVPVQEVWDLSIQ